MTVETKICGLSTDETLQAAINAGARYIGFVFYPPSPRNVDIETAARLCNLAGENILKVGVFVNPDDEFLSRIIDHVDIDVIQLHGNETIERVQYIRARYSKLVMKAISVASVGDINRAREYEKEVDILLFDAKAPIDMDDALPGGNGLAFDWQLIAGQEWHVPWMLSGGLDPKNVTDAIKTSGTNIVDVSSGVENAPGDKDIKKINAFIKAVRQVK